MNLHLTLHCQQDELLVFSPRLRVAASRVLARPKFDELAPFENAPATKIVTGNPGLAPSRAWSYDAGFDCAARWVTFTVNGFRKNIRGVLEEVGTGEWRRGREIFQVRRAGNGRTRGLEFEQRLRPGARGRSRSSRSGSPTSGEISATRSGLRRFP